MTDDREQVFRDFQKHIEEDIKAVELFLEENETEGGETKLQFQLGLIKRKLGAIKEWSGNCIRLVYEGNDKELHERA